MFLSTPPSRVATFSSHKQQELSIVSIHATLAGGDSFRTLPTYTKARFYPRHPRGWRRAAGGQAVSAQCFYPRHPRGWRPLANYMLKYPKRFLSTPPSRVATARLWQMNAPTLCFYPRHPRGWRRPTGSGAQALYRRFYPRHPRGWRRPMASHNPGTSMFLSTPPSRVATSQKHQWKRTYMFLSTPPSRVATSCFCAYENP